MKKYCIECGREVKKITDENGEEHLVCKKCNTLNDDEVLGKYEIHKYNQSVHNNITKANDLRDNSLCFIIIGAILLIVGAVFLVLTFKRLPSGLREFKPWSLEFLLTIICLTLSISSLTFGMVRLIMALQRKDYFKKALRK